MNLSFVDLLRDRPATSVAQAEAIADTLMRDWLGALVRDAGGRITSAQFYAQHGPSARAAFSHMHSRGWIVARGNIIKATAKGRQAVKQK